MRLSYIKQLQRNTTIAEKQYSGAQQSLAEFGL